MSAEIKTVDGKIISWSDHNAGSFQEIQVGRYTFDPTLFHIHVLKFLSGARQIDFGPVYITIPDQTTGKVEFGHLEFPYSGYVEGVVWSLTQLGVFDGERRVPQVTAIQIFALGALRRELLEKVPERNELMYNLAQRYQEDHKQDGIYGLKPARLLVSERLADPSPAARP